MEFQETRWSFPWNLVTKTTQKSARACGNQGGLGVEGKGRVVGVLGLTEL